MTEASSPAEQQLQTILEAAQQMGVELDREDGSFHGEGFDGHHGFARDDLGTRLRGAGFTDVAFQDCHFVEKNGRDYPMFLVTATR